MDFYDKYIKYKNKYTRLLQSYTNIGNEATGTYESIGSMDESIGSMDKSIGSMDGGAVKGCSMIKGSGVIIVSIINDTPCILLPREKNKSYAIRHKLNNNLVIDKFNLHEDIGGGIHYSNLTVEENTIFELYEETAGYIICNPSKLKKKIVDKNNNKYDSHIDLEFRKGSIYRCYIIGIDGTQLNINQMNSNLNILTKYKKFIDKPFFECDKWTWFPIKNFNNNKNYIQAPKVPLVPNYKSNFNETYIIVNDTFNNPKFISSRTWKILLQSYNKQGIKGIDLCYKTIKNINNINKLKLYNKNDYTTILPLLQFPITSVYL